MDNPKLVEQVFDLYFERLYRYFYYKTLSKEDAEDLTSETFLAYAEQLRKDPQLINSSNYIYGIARNILMKFLRRRYNFPSTNLAIIPDISVEVVQLESKADSLVKIIAELIVKLPEKQQQIIRMRLVEKQTLSEIATALGKDMNYVKTTQRRAIYNLKMLLACTPVGN